MESNQLEDKPIDEEGAALEQLETDNSKAEEEEEEEPEEGGLKPSHFQNAEAHPSWVRYGIPFFLLATLVLLINADVGSGVSADYILMKDGEVEDGRALLLVSVFSSVKELWHNGSYPLAILIAVTSIAWPYVKIILSFYAWVRPYSNPRKRELLIEILDALGKWSFVDIVVLVEIMVAFRASIPLSPTVTLEIVVLPKWGFYGFVLATMMSLLSTHIILHYHRKLQYHTDRKEEPVHEPDPEQTIENNQDSEPEKIGMKAKEGLSNRYVGCILFSLIASMAFYIAGCIINGYEVTNTRGPSSFVEDYSVVSVGQAIPEAVLDSSDFGIRWIQAMWFLLVVVMPLWCSFLFGILFLYPLTRQWMERIFVMAEIAFAWSCAEVLLVSTIFSVLQMSSFGDGLIESDCAACFVIDTQILPDFGYLVVGTVLNVGVNVWLYRKAHHAVYGAF